MITSKTQKIFIALVVLLVLGFFGYSLFNSSPDTTANPAGLSNTEVAGQDILALVDKLKNISINQTVFSSALFSNLIDFSTVISPESQGRTNPFAPIGSDLPSSANTGSSR